MYDEMRAICVKPKSRLTRYEPEGRMFESCRAHHLASKELAR
jgi:hypothetical protein